MDLFSLGFVLLILVASGGIAFVADGLGKKIGKKRLSIAGLRPKHVAQLGTVGMGVAVSFLTILFVAAVSRDARTWLRRGSGLIADIQRLEEKGRTAQAENGRLGDEGRRLQTLNAGLDRTNIGLKADIDSLKESLKGEEGELSKERASLVVVRAERKKLVSERERLTAQTRNLKGQVAAARRQYERTSGLLARARTNLEVAEIAYRAIQKDLLTAQQTANTRYLEADRALKKGMETYKENQRLIADVAKKQQEVADRTAAVEALKKEQADLVKERDAAEAQVADAQKRYADLLNQLDDAGNLLAKMQDQLQGQQDFLASTYRTSRTESLTFRKGEELARIVVPGGSGADATAVALTGLLRAARQEAAARGARPLRGNGQSYEAADIVDRKDPKTGRVVAAETLRRSVVASVAGKPSDQVIVASSSLNAFAGEPVSLDLAVMPNPLVYHRNETVAEAQIDGAQTEDRILAQLSDFMAGRVRDRAKKDRMIPRAGTAALFGELSTFEVFNLVRDVKQRGRSVRVTAVADRDVRAADPLSLEFRVR